MFSSRRLKAIVLLVAVMAAGFVLFDTFFVQETTAQLSNLTCDTLYAYCSAWRGIASYMCSKYGSESATCGYYVGKALTKCWPWLTQCGGG